MRMLISHWDLVNINTVQCQEAAELDRAEYPGPRDLLGDLEFAAALSTLVSSSWAETLSSLHLGK